MFKNIRIVLVSRNDHKEIDLVNEPAAEYHHVVFQLQTQYIYTMTNKIARLLFLKDIHLVYWLVVMFHFKVCLSALGQISMHISMYIFRCNLNHSQDIYIYCGFA